MVTRKVLGIVRETGQFSSKGIICDFIGNLNRLTVSRLITESASDSLNEPYNIYSALDIKIQNIVKTLLNSIVTRSAVKTLTCKHKTQDTSLFNINKTLLEKSNTCKLI